MQWLLALGFLFGIFSGVHCNERLKNDKNEDLDVVNVFLKDIISTFKLLSPTIIYEEVAPDVCMTENWVLCLPNFQRGSIDGLANHLITVHNISKHDGVIFLQNELNQELLELLTSLAPFILNTNVPAFMPKEYVEMIKLRLDSNVIFYEKEAMNKFSLFDIFAVKGGPLITLDIGDWDTENGTRLKENIVRWERRTDLKGAEFINALAFNGAAARFTYDHYCEYSAARIFVLR